MPNQALCQVKCEPASDDEDSDSQFAQSFLSTQLNTALRPENIIKLEPSSSSGEEHVHSPSQLLHHLQGTTELEELSVAAPAGPAATPVCVKQEPADPVPSATLETLHTTPHNTTTSTLLERHLSLLSSEIQDSCEYLPLFAVKDEPLSEGEQHTPSSEDTSDSSPPGGAGEPTRGSPKSWSQKDMESALDALRNHHMSLTKASATYGIPSTTLWQRAHRLGIDTPKKEGTAKSWGEADLRRALHALRAGAISANKASKAYGIPSSTLYKIARREGIRLAAPFNAAPTAWRRADLEQALASIRAGDHSVQRAASLYGIPTGTLYGRCKREGIELSRSNPTPWSEDAMGEALEAVRVGQMSINQAAIHYNLPYSSLYGRFKRCKYQVRGLPQMPNVDHQKPEPEHQQDMNQFYPHPHHEEMMQPMVYPDHSQVMQGMEYQNMYYACNLAS